MICCFPPVPPQLAPDTALGYLCPCMRTRNYFHSGNYLPRPCTNAVPVDLLDALPAGCFNPVLPQSPADLLDVRHGVQTNCSPNPCPLFVARRCPASPVPCLSDVYPWPYRRTSAPPPVLPFRLGLLDAFIPLVCVSPSDPPPLVNLFFVFLLCLCLLYFFYSAPHRKINACLLSYPVHMIHALQGLRSCLDHDRVF